MLSLTSFEELASMLEKLEKIATPGYHRIYYETKVKKAISKFDRLGPFKYLFSTSEYRQLVKKAQAEIAGD